MNGLFNLQSIGAYHREGKLRDLRTTPFLKLSTPCGVCGGCSAVIDDSPSFMPADVPPGAEREVTQTAIASMQTHTWEQDYNIGIAYASIQVLLALLDRAFERIEKLEGKL